MKRILIAILAVTMALSMTACGGTPAKSSSSASPSSSSKSSSSTASTTTSSKPSSKPAAAPKNLENKEFTAEQTAAAQKFLDLATRYDKVADKLNADPNLSQMQVAVDSMNGVADALIEADGIFADPASLTAETLKGLDAAVAQTNLFLDEVEAMLANYAGKQTVTVTVEIMNSTGVELHGLAMSPTSSDSWGSNLLGAPLKEGQFGVTEMTFTSDSLVWDLLAMDSEGSTLSFMGLDFSEVSTDGAKLLLSVTEGGGYVASFQ